MKKRFIAVLGMLVLPLAWSAEEAPPPSPSLQGEVREVLDAGAFTYLRLQTPQGETWAGVPKTAVTAGAQVTILDPVVMQNFESKALKRKFETVVFGTLAGAATAASSPHGASPPAGDLAQIHGGAVRAPDLAAVSVAKAEGPDARTIAEVYAERLALKDRPVVIRAKVVKVTPAVMGRNWIHLRDGTGAPADGSDDLVATSQDEPKVGDVVVAKGVVKADVNLGSGYAYKVLVEDTSFRK